MYVCTQCLNWLKECYDDDDHVQPCPQCGCEHYDYYSDEDLFDSDGVYIGD